MAGVDFSQLPGVPLTIEGSWVLHQMLRLRRPLDPGVAGGALELLARLEGENSAFYSLLGHKGDLMLVHFRPTPDALNSVEWELSRLALWESVDVVSSYVSVVELGLYESTVKEYAALASQGVEPNTPEWQEAVKDVMARQAQAMAPRLHPRIPDAPYVCFYPMDRRRGESKNWYTVPMPERQRMMHEHGLVGRRYAGDVKQIITGSIGFDDWEWGVDLFAGDPLVFKRLIYEMRFDEVSAVYAQFGSFYLGIRKGAAQLVELLSGPSRG